MDIHFSVIIPSYNRANTIEATIRSFLQQEHPLFEILVVDDGSTDNTKDVVASFLDERVNYYKKENGERGAARNFGVAKATGGYITFFDSDDIVYPYYLSHAARQLKLLNMPACYAQAFEVRNSPPVSFPPLHREGTVSEINGRLLYENVLACNGIFLRKEVAEKFRFSENRELSGSEDWLLWLQIAASFPFYYSPVVCSCLVNHDQRGELNLEAGKLLKRLNLLIELIKEDGYIAILPPDDKRKVFASAYLFAGLKMAAFSRYKIKSVYYLLRAFLQYPGVIFRKSLYVVFKQLVFEWQ